MAAASGPLLPCCRRVVAARRLRRHLDRRCRTETVATDRSFDHHRRDLFDSSAPAAGPPRRLSSVQTIWGTARAPPAGHSIRSTSRPRGPSKSLRNDSAAGPCDPSILGASSIDSSTHRSILNHYTAVLAPISTTNPSTLSSDNKQAARPAAAAAPDPSPRGLVHAPVVWYTAAQTSQAKPTGSGSTASCGWAGGDYKQIHILIGRCLAT